MAVDTVAQYIFIYRACLEYIKFDDLNDDYIEQHIKLNTEYYPNRLSYNLIANPNDIVAINYHNITQNAQIGILPEFDV